MSQKKLSTLPFVDLYVCLDGSGLAHHRVSMKGLPKHPDIIVPADYSEDLAKLAQHIRNHGNKDSALIQYDDMRLRIAYIQASNGETWVALRKVKNLPPPLASLGFPPALLPHLEAMGKREGLILICGATGQGKTTTCNALLVDYMTRYGGVGFTIEDPVEYNLAGRHGESGYCYQVEVKEDKEWTEALTTSLRCHPRYIFLGEVCTPDVANQLLRASTSGHLVIATLHGGSFQEGLEGLLQLAEQRIGTRAQQLLSSSLTAVIHQTLGQHGMSSSFLFLDYGSQSASVRTLIRENHLSQLKAVVDKQYAKLMQNGQIF